MAGTSQYVEFERFRDFAEEVLESPIASEHDALAVYSFFDLDGDNKVSLDDFLGFIHSQSAEISRMLEPKNLDVIVDIKLSNSRIHDAELTQQGYVAVLPDTGNKPGTSTINPSSMLGSFGKGQSIWIWKRRQGTCGGRLKPIIDIQLDKSDKSSALVLSGYICLLPSISGQVGLGETGDR